MKQWIKDLYQFIQKYPIAIWLIFIGITSTIYYGTQDIVLNDDAFQFFSEFKKEGWGGFYQNYGFSSLYYFTHFFNLLFYHLFGLNNVCWLILLIVLHATNAYLIHCLFNAFYLQHRISNAFLISLAGAILFLISPAQSENVTWVATLHYGLSLLFFLLIGLNIIRGEKEFSSTRILLLLFFYSLSLLTMEFALIFPFCWFLMQMKFSIQTTTIKNKKLWLGFLLLIPVYFITTKFIKGHFIPHYSTEHLENHTPIQYITNYTNYASKHLFLSHFYPSSVRYYNIINHWFSLLIIWSFILWLFYRYTKKKASRAFVLLKLFVLSVFMLMPVINMYFNIIHQYENNRLGYYFSIALFQLTTFILFESLHIVRFIGFLIIIILNLYFSYKTTTDAKIAGHIFKHCLETFPDLPKKNIYLINMPNNYKGFYLFRDTWRLSSALDFFYQKQFNFNQIASTNLLNKNDSFYCIIESDSVLRAGHNNPGDYFMKGPYGAYDREDSAYSFDVDEWLMNYEVRFKKPLSTEDRVLLFKKDRFIIVR